MERKTIAAAKTFFVLLLFPTENLICLNEISCTLTLNPQNGLKKKYQMNAQSTGSGMTIKYTRLSSREGI